MTKTRNAFSVNHYAYEPLEAGAIVENQIKQVEQVGAAIRRAVKRANSREKQAAICVSANNVISRTITVQAGLDDDELESAVQSEVDQFVPYALDEVNIDFHRLGRSQRAAPEAGAGEEDEDVQVVVCRKEVVNDYATVLGEANLEPLVVDVDSFILSRIYSLVCGEPADQDEKRLRALFDFGYSNSRLIVFDDNQVVYSRELPCGGQFLLDSIQSRYDMAPKVAIQSLRKSNMPENFKTKVLKPFVKQLIQELIRALHFFYSSSTYNQVDELMITGGCVSIGNLEKIIQRRVDLPTVIMNPFEFMRIGPKIRSSNFQREIPFLTIAAGLAIRGLHD